MLNLTQVDLAANTAARLCTVPPGPVTVVLTNTGTAAVAVGVADTVTATNGTTPNFTPGGALIPVGGSVTISGYPGSAGVTLFGISTAAANVGVFISTSG